VVIMNKGRIVAEESIAGLKKDNFNVFEVKVVGEPAPFFAELSSLRCRVEEKDQALFHIRLPGDVAPAALFRAADKSGVQIRHFKQSRTSLEDAFMDVIREADGH